jgi:hypothetical protein
MTQFRRKYFELPETRITKLTSLSQIDPIHTIPSYLSKIHFNIVHPPTSGARGSVVG